MSIKFRRTGVDITGQTPVLVQKEFGGAVRWCLWLAYNGSFSEGTYLILFDDGAIWRETTQPDGGVHTVVITPSQRKPRLGPRL